MMRLRKISIKNVRKFISPLIIDGLCDGVNIIAGDNEDGKSTILHAVRAALCTKYSVTGKELQWLQPYGSVANPEIGLDFDLGAERYSLKKCFGKKGSAELRSAGTIFNGSEVEEQLQKLCFTGSAEKSKDLAQSNIWSVLWVDQGTAFLSPEVGELGRKTLQTALEGELGKIVGGDDGQAILRNIKDLYLEWYTPTGRDKEKSEYKVALDHLQKLKLAHAEASQKFEHFEKTIEQLDSVRADLRNHEEQKSLAAAKEQYEAALVKQKGVAAKRAEHQQAQQKEKAESAEYTAASEAWRLRRSILTDIEDVQKRTKENKEKTGLLQSQHAAAAQLRTTAMETQTAQKQAYESALKAFDLAEDVELLIRLATSKRVQDENLAGARAAAEKAQSIQKEGSAIKIDRASLEKLRLLERQLFEADTKLKACATQLEFKPDAGSIVSVDDQPLDTANSMLLTEETTFTLAGWGQIHVRPGGGELKALKVAVETNKTKFAAELAALGVSGIKHAEELDRRKTALQTEFNTLKAEALKYAPAGIPALANECATIADQLKEIRSKFGADADDHTLKSLDEAKAALQVSRNNRDVCRNQLAEADKTLATCVADFNRIDAQVKELLTQEKTFIAEQSRLDEKLAKERTKEDDTLLDQRMTEAKVRLGQASALRQTLETELQNENADALDQQVVALATALEKLQAQLQILREAEIRLTTSLQEQGTTGIAEELQKLSGKIEQCEETVNKTRKHSRAIKLLWDTLSETEQSSKDQLTGPLMIHLEPLIAEVFDDGRLGISSASFSITHIDRSGVTEPYDHLSVGTREQLSVLTRLAFANVLAESGVPAIVVLDDALVYSDEERLQKMQQTILRAGKKFQVLILTCRQRDYKGLDANFIRLPDCLNNSAVSGLVAM